MNQKRPKYNIDTQNPLDILHRQWGHLEEHKIKRALRLRAIAGPYATYEQVKDLHLTFCKDCRLGAMRAFPTIKTTKKWEILSKNALVYKGPFPIRIIPFPIREVTRRAAEEHHLLSTDMWNFLETILHEKLNLVLNSGGVTTASATTTTNINVDQPSFSSATSPLAVSPIHPYNDDKFQQLLSLLNSMESSNDISPMKMQHIAMIMKTGGLIWCALFKVYLYQQLPKILSKHLKNLIKITGSRHYLKNLKILKISDPEAMHNKLAAL